MSREIDELNAYYLEETERALEEDVQFYWLKTRQGPHDDCDCYWMYRHDLKHAIKRLRAFRAGVYWVGRP